MKKILLSFMTLAFISCGESSECSYSKLKMTNQIGDGEIKEGSFEGCFKASQPNELGIIEVTDNDNRIKVTYDKASRFLNIKPDDGETIKYRVNEGHQIMVVKDNKDTLAIIYGDIKGSKSKSSLLFIK